MVSVTDCHSKSKCGKYISGIAKIVSFPDFVGFCTTVFTICYLFISLLPVAHSSTFNFGEERPRCLIIFNHSGVFLSLQ